MKKSYQLRNTFLLLQAATPVLSVLVGSLALGLAVTAKRIRCFIVSPGLLLSAASHFIQATHVGCERRGYRDAAILLLVVL